VGYFKSSVAVDATAEDSFAYVDDDEHLRAFVSAVEPDETFEDDADGAWFRPGAVFHHRVDWHGVHSHGWVWVIGRGDASDLVAEVHTRVDKEDLDARLDAALFAMQDGIEHVQPSAGEIPRPEESGSFVVEFVLKGLIRHLPGDRRRQLDPYLQRAPQLDGSPTLEAQRAARARAWADEVAAADHPLLGRRVVGFIEHVRHVAEKSDEESVAAEGAVAARTGWVSTRFAVPPEAIAAIDPAGVPEGFRHELDESQDAVTEAGDMAAHHGWDEVPWKQLLDDLFAI
jgi:hypothetical protein